VEIEINYPLSQYRMLSAELAAQNSSIQFIQNLMQLFLCQR